ncbi:MAG: hypothetical protein GY839_01755, partial [candidate division Zixibacteria bacterium]|nr:hypothetical protein [candidate division Zixibacteria bacterium]
MSDLDVIREIEEIFNLKFRNYIRLENNLGEYTLDKNGKVTTLILSGIKITNFNRIISPLKQLKNLTKLFIHSNKLNDISLLKDLTTLSELNLSNNQIEDVSPLKDLKDLEVLLLSQNRINDIAALKYLKKLNFLWLWDNQIKDISPLKNLKKLKEIGLNSNNIEELPIWITDFNLDILYDIGAHDGKIHIGGNPLKSPPVEIAKQGKEAIKNYFSQLEKQGKDKIYEAKLMLVGEPGAGKTTLMNLLFDKEHPVPDMDQKSTTGIEVRQNWAFSIDRKKGFKAHIWDFGGQQIQYMLHQFFLTSDCVYVLMAEKRRELAKFEYWLNIINILGKNSPVVVVFNEINIDSVSSFIYDEKKYNNLFPELSLRRLDINLADMEDGRFDVLQNTIKIKLGSLQHIGKEVPARWVDIRKELENRRKKKHININEYFKICKKFDIEKEADQMLILGYFHLLGIVLHFHEDENLCDTLFLDPNWTVDAVYSVLANKEIEKSKGFIKKSDIDKIWSEKDYDIEERTKLLQLMLKDNFELCYKLPGTENQYIVPLLLSPQKPEYDWDSNNNLQFRFQYPFMPKGIVSRLIVRMHEYIDQNHVWKEGVVFRRNSASAQVIEQKTMKEGLKIIEIRLKGTPNNRKELLTLIREEIKKIQNSSFPNLPYSEMIPCNCRECKTAETPYFFNYDDIETYL